MTRVWNRWRIVRWSIVAVLLMVPLVMMQISDEWHWGVGSFIFAGGILGGTLYLFEWAMSLSLNIAYRTGMAVALVTALLLVWVNLAVGFVGEEGNPTNLSFFCLVLSTAVAAFAARFRADGMARAMLGVAAIQAILGMLIATAPSTAREPAGAIGVLLLSGFFTALWLIAAALFHKAARSMAA